MQSRLPTDVWAHAEKGQVCVGDRGKGDMAYVGFVLVSAVAGSEQQVYKSLEGMREIRELYLMNGEFDIMAKVKADNPQKISEFTTKKVRALPNVRTAHTLIGPDFWMK